MSHDHNHGQPSTPISHDPGLLTATNFTRPALIKWLQDRLGGMIWRLEGFDCLNTAEQAIEDAVMLYGKENPIFGWQPLQVGQREWELPANALGVFKVFFIDASSFFTRTAYEMNQNLVGVASIQMAGGKVGEFADFLQWRKMFQRVLSQRPTYQYDEMSNKVFIQNPAGYRPTVLYTMIRPFEKTPIKHQFWIRDWALAEMKDRLATHRNKFKGALPGPGGSTINLDSDTLAGEAEKAKEKLEKKLADIRPRYPLMWD